VPYEKHEAALQAFWATQKTKHCCWILTMAMEMVLQRMKIEDCRRSLPVQLSA
jgi:hypothetical protein